mmetsp:Transcript_29731/g.59110  ORF Transcript_29731/g.59110 Transcript_29731/m.59110 type:complete len:263 (+) Transcript_29731:1258-2046(+)
MAPASQHGRCHPTRPDPTGTSAPARPHASCAENTNPSECWPPQSTAQQRGPHPDRAQPAFQTGSEYTHPQALWHSPIGHSAVSKQSPYLVHPPPRRRAHQRASPRVQRSQRSHRKTQPSAPDHVPERPANAAHTCCRATPSRGSGPPSPSRSSAPSSLSSRAPAWRYLSDAPRGIRVRLGANHGGRYGQAFNRRCSDTLRGGQRRANRIAPRALRPGVVCHGRRVFRSRRPAGHPRSLRVSDALFSGRRPKGPWDWRPARGA